MNEQENIYLFNYWNKISDALGAALELISQKRGLRLTEIKKILGDAKKQSVMLPTYLFKAKKAANTLNTRVVAAFFFLAAKLKILP